MKIAFVSCAEKSYDLKSSVNNFKILIDSFLDKKIKIFWIDLGNLIYKNNKKKISNTKINFFCPNNSNEALNLIKKNKFILVDCLPKDIKLFKIFRLINKSNSKLIAIHNDQTRVLLQKKNYLKRINLPFLKYTYIHKLMIILNIFPRTDILFISSKILYKQFANGFSKRLDKIIKRNFFADYKKIKLVNNVFFDTFLLFKKKISKSKKKNIVFLDTAPFDHPALKKYSNEKIKKNNRKKFYENLYIFLKHLEKVHKKKIIICLHPKYNSKYKKRDFKDLSCKVFKTHNYIFNSSLLLFITTSMVMQGIYLKKSIINLSSSYLPIFFQKESKDWRNILPFCSINIDNRDDYKEKLPRMLKNENLKINKKIYNSLINNHKLTSTEQILNYLRKI